MWMNTLLFRVIHNKPLSWCMTRTLSHTQLGSTNSISQTQQRCRNLKDKKKKKPVPFNPGASWEERLSDVATPLWRMGYKEQLEYKLNALRSTLRDITIHVRARGGKVVDCDGLFCPLQDIIPSPVMNGYRNKSSFSVNRGPDGDPKTVGNFVGTGRDRNIVCVRADHLINIPEKHKHVARCYEDFIHQSPLAPCLLFYDGGHWRDVVVRTNKKGETMAIVTFHPQDLPQVLDLRLRVSPTSFLQVNTPAAETLYTALGNMIQRHAHGTLLDLCCGTGAIGLSLAGYFKNVIGVEMVEDAVLDARWNADFNGIENCQFLSGRAEKLLPNLLSYKQKELSVLAVANPPRAGLHPRVVRALRNCEDIRTLLFVTCKPEGEATRNLTELCCAPSLEQKILGEAFVPQEALGVDLFPHTTHCELALLLTR
ncbi:hypothetical protein XENTR_v10020697 [Xenopus tropicalis]|nr:hypothetical protein XENTR_v10020697 [Xenopus tropicalis]